MKWFGKSWGAPVCNPADHVEVLPGTECGYCRLPVDGGAGLVTPYLTAPGGPTEAVYHHNCFAELLGLKTCVHVLKGGFPLCGFSDEQPGRWPYGHTWVSIVDPREATCPGCLARVLG